MSAAIEQASSGLAVPAAAAAAQASTSTAPAASPTDLQKAFWEDSLSTHSSSLLQTMLLHDNESEAEAMNAGEMEEIFSICRIQKEWTVCEWAAGMGRLTPLLAQQCRFVYSSDFVQSFCDANAKRCEELQVKNVQVERIDAAEYQPKEGGVPPFQTNLFDLVFVNWLLLYLDDTHAEKFLKAATSSLKEKITTPRPSTTSATAAASSSGNSTGSGLIFLHESCWERSRESAWFATLPSSEQQRVLSLPTEKTEDCHTFYRTTFWYEALFNRCGLEVMEKKELSVYRNFSGADEEEGQQAAAGTQQQTKNNEEKKENGTLVIEDDHYNKQMCWLLRIRQQ